MLIVSTMYSKSNNEQYDTDMSDKIMSCKDRTTGYNFKKNGTQDLVPSFSRTDCFNCVVKEWNSLPNHIREDNKYLKLFKMYLLCGGLNRKKS